MEPTESNTNQQQPHPVYDAPGCGFAGYSCLLLGIFFIGLLGLVVSSISLLSEQYRKAPYYLTPGTKVEVWRLQPMRDVQLLDLTEIPTYYHDEVGNGETACALTQTSLLRVEEASKGWKVPYTDIEKIEFIKKDGREAAMSYLANGDVVPCFFEIAEGVHVFISFIRERMNTEN